jgi:predicted Zn-dependent protease
MMTRTGSWLTVLALTSCGDGLGGLLISDEQEVEMGLGVDQEIRKEYKLAAASDPAAQWLVQFIAPLATASTQFREPNDIGGYKVAVIVDDTLVNAFAAPGGYTYLSTGLVLQAETCAEIAGVMGHELAHVTERHGVKSIEEAYGVQVISEWFLGEGLASEAAGTIWSFLQNTTFSQEHEAEADSVGLRISHDAGYNPYGIVDFFTKLLALEGENVVPQFLSSHPATADRIADVAAQIESRYGDSVNPGTTQTYDCIGTSMSLEQLKAHIRSGRIAVDTGTGTQPPAQ